MRHQAGGRDASCPNGASCETRMCFTTSRIGTQRSSPHRPAMESSSPLPCGPPPLTAPAVGKEGKMACRDSDWLIVEQAPCMPSLGSGASVPIPCPCPLLIVHRFPRFWKRSDARTKKSQKPGAVRGTVLVVFQPLTCSWQTTQHIDS
jgi:hypothetical protein